MRPRRLLAPHDTTAIFTNAVRERALAVITYHDGDQWGTFKSRFLESDPRARYFVLDYQSPMDEPLPEIVPGQYFGISFRQRSRKILFSTVVEAKGHYVLDDKTTIAAIRYRWPNSMTELQRRAYYRTPVPEDIKLLASIWPGGLTARAAAEAEALQILPGELADVSCGGAAVRLHQPTPPNWKDNDLVGVELQMPDGRPPLQIDARFRGLRSNEDEGQIAAAVQFIGLEMTVDGRLVLKRLADAVQRLHRQSTNSGRRPQNRN